MTRVGVVVVTYNRFEQLLDTLAAIADQSVASTAVVVVDNASPDRTADRLDEIPRFEVDLVRSSTNSGAAAGRAIGMTRLVEAHDVDLCWIVDDDSPPLPHALETLLRVKRQIPSAGIIGVRGGYRRFGVIRRIEQGVGPRPNPGEPPTGSVDFVHLDGALIDMAAVHACGVPRDDYFIMMEDVEYPLRLRTQGWDVVLVDEALADLKHLGSAAPWRLYYQTRNELLMARDLRSPWALFGWLVRNAAFTAAHLRQGRAGLGKIRLRAVGAWHGVRNVRGRTLGPWSTSKELGT